MLAGTVTIRDLDVTNASATGGAGGDSGGAGGGGGLGAGAALLVNSGADVTIANVDFTGNSVTGGAGGTGGTVAAPAAAGAAVSPAPREWRAATGSLAKRGLGTLVLSGANTYSGGTTVSGGKLHLTGSLAGNVTVNAGTTLTGTGNGVTTGKIAGNLTNSGIVAPGAAGSPVGTLAVGGNFTMNPGSFLDIALTAPPTASKLVVGGTATLAGTLRLKPGSGGYVVSTVYTVVDAAQPITGNFATVTNSGSAFVTLAGRWSAATTG